MYDFYRRMNREKEILPAESRRENDALWLSAYASAFSVVNDILFEQQI
jgi:hypothetical protein